MSITTLGVTSYLHVTDEREVTILLSPTGELMLFCPMENISQAFDIPTRAALADLPKLFPSEEVVRAKAKLHKDGTLNKTKFIESISSFLSSGILTQPQFDELEEFISTHNCNPDKIMRRLCHMGYKFLAENSLFAYRDDLPEFTRSVTLMMEFLHEVGKSGEAQ